MVSDIYIDKETSAETNHLGTIMCLFIFFLTISGCSKSSEDDATGGSPPDLSIINESLKSYMFVRQDFEDPEKVWPFLQTLVGLYYGSPHHLIGSSVTLRSIERGDISSWLRGREKSEAVFRELCLDPQFLFEGNKWKVLFNVFKPDGSVDKWEVVGEHDPENEYNHIEKIETNTLKPKGTFFCPLMSTKG